MEETRLVEIESKLAHQEQLLFELNEVLTDQQTQLMQLKELCAVLLERLRSVADGGPDDSGQEQPPPHY